MTEEVKIYAYKLSITEGNIKVEEIEFSVIEKQETFILKQDGDYNAAKRVVYDLNSPIIDECITEKRDYMIGGRKTLKKDELGELLDFNSLDTLVYCYREPSLNKAMSVFKAWLEWLVVGLQKKIEKLTNKMHDCEKFVAGVKGGKV